jgi:hypothetical protein
MLGRHHSVSTRDKLSNSVRTFWSTHDHPSIGKKRSQETVDKWRKSIGNKFPYYGKENTAYGKKYWLGRHHTDETKERQRRKMIERLKAGMYSSRPNGLEKKMISILKQLKAPYKYVGNFKFWIEDMNPDFVNVNGKKEVVELFGCYYHGCPVHYKENGKIKDDSRSRKKSFGKYGFECKIIWEHDIRDVEKIKTIIGLGGDVR